MSSNNYDDTDSFFDTEPKPLKGEYDRGNTTPVRRDYSPSLNISGSGQRSPAESPTVSPKPSARRSHKMAHHSKSNRRHSYDSQSRGYSGYSDVKSHTKDDHYESYSDDDFESDSDYDKRSPRRGGGKFGSSKTNTMRRVYSGGSSTYSTTSGHGRSGYRPKASQSDKKYLDVYQPDHKKKGTGRKTGKGRSHSQGSKMSPRESVDVVAKRMLSARLHSISRLKNELGELKHDYDEVIRENKLLRTLQRKQERAIDKYEGQQNDLGDLLSRHNSELEHLQKLVHKYKSENLDKERRLRDKDDELAKTRHSLKRLKAIARERNLLERDELDHKLQETQEELDRKDKRVQDLERYIENLKKNHRVESIDLRVKQKENEGQLQHLQHEYDKMRITLKEREKELEVRNIYSNRAKGASTRLSNSVSATPHPTPRKVKTANKAVQAVDLSEDHKPAPAATQIDNKLIEEKEEEEVAEEEEEEEEPARESSFDREKERKMQEMDEEERRRKEEAERILREFDMSAQRDTDEQRKREEEERLAMEKKKQERERQERERRERELREQREKEERERKAREEKERKEKEEAGFKPTFPNSFSSISSANQSQAPSERTRGRHEPEQETSYKPSFDSSSSKPLHASSKDPSSTVTFKPPMSTFRKDAARSSQGVHLAGGRSRLGAGGKNVHGTVTADSFHSDNVKEHTNDIVATTTALDKHSKTGLAANSPEHKALKPNFVREGLVTTTTSSTSKSAVNVTESVSKVSPDQESSKAIFITEERRERERREEEERELAKKHHEVDEERRKKDLLLAKMREIDSGKNPSPASAKSAKHYNFSDPVENLHHGVPSHPVDGSHSGKKKKRVEEEGEDDSLEFGSYAPSFGRRAEKQKGKPKSDWSYLTEGSPATTPERKTSPPQKKSDLMSNLFGDPQPTDKPAKASLGDNIFTAATKAKPVADKDAYPWEKDVNVAKTGRRSGFHDDGDGDDKLLPRRPRDSNAVFASSKPTVNAVDDFDDDIEEVIL